MQKKRKKKRESSSFFATTNDSTDKCRPESPRSLSGHGLGGVGPVAGGLPDVARHVGADGDGRRVPASGDGAGRRRRGRQLQRVEGLLQHLDLVLDDHGGRRGQLIVSRTTRIAEGRVALLP